MSEWGEQLGLFGSNGFPQLSRDRIGEVERTAVRIARSFGLDVSTIRWKNNRRVMASIGKNGVLNLHRIYMRASEPDLVTLARVLCGKAKPPDREKFQRYIENNLPRELGRGKSRLIVMPPKGLFHNLNQAMERLQSLLDKPLDPMPKFGWSPARVGRRGVTWGTHRDITEGPLVLVNAILDAPDVPNFVIEHIVWHEICHQASPPEEGNNGRRKVHSAAFRKMEARYPRLKEAEKWEQNMVTTLIRRHTGWGK